MCYSFHFPWCYRVLAQACLGTIAFESTQYLLNINYSSANNQIMVSQLQALTESVTNCTVDCTQSQHSSSLAETEQVTLLLTVHNFNILQLWTNAKLWIGKMDYIKLGCEVKLYYITIRSRHNRVLHLSATKLYFTTIHIHKDGHLAPLVVSCCAFSGKEGTSP